MPTFRKAQTPTPWAVALGRLANWNSSPGDAEEREDARNVRGKEGVRSIYKGPGAGVGICRTRGGARRNTPPTPQALWRSTPLMHTLATATRGRGGRDVGAEGRVPGQVGQNHRLKR